MPANVQGLLSDPQFNALDLPTQKATLGQLDPTFAGLSDDDYKAFKQGMGTSAPAGPAAPPPARPPLPPGLRPGAGLLQTLSNDPNAPKDDPSLAGRLTGTSGIIPGMLRVAGGVNRFANAPSGSERAGGISDIARGGMQTAAPFTIPFGANAPIRSLVGLGAGTVTGATVEGGAKALGVPAGYAEAAGTAAGIEAGRRAGRLGGGNRNLPPPATPAPAPPATNAVNPIPPVPEIANTPAATPAPTPTPPTPGAKPPLTTGQAVGKVVTRRFIPGVSTVLRARDDYQMVRDAMRNDAAQQAAQSPQAPGPAARRPAGAAAAPATPIPQVSGSTAVPRLFQRGGNLPPQAIPPGGPQTGTVPGTVEQPPLPPEPPQGSTANMQQATQNAPQLPPTNRPAATGTIPGTVDQPPPPPPPAPPVPGANAVQGTVGIGRRLPPAAVPGRTPIGSLPLNPPTGTGTTPPQTPPVTPPPTEVPPAPPAPPPPAGGTTPTGPQVGLNSRFAKAQSANDAKVGGLQKQLVADIQSGAITPDTIASHPDWQPHGTGGAGPAWKALAKRAGVSDKFSNAPDNSPNQVLQKLGISRMMPQPAQQQQGANVPVSVSAAIQRLESGPGNYVDIPTLRQELGPNADQQILQAARKENLVLAESGSANRTTDPDLLDGGNGKYYVGVARSRNAPAAAPPAPVPPRNPAMRTGSFAPGGMQVRTTYRGGKEVPPAKPDTQDIDFQQRFGEKEQPEVAKFLGHDQPASPPSGPGIRTFRFTDPRSGDTSVLAVDPSRQVNTDNIADPSGITLEPSSIDARIGTRWRQTLDDAGYRPENVVGVTHMSKQGNTMHPDQVYVLPEVRRQGVGTAMYDEAQKGFPAGTTLGTGLRTGPGRAFRTSYDAQKQAASATPTAPVTAPAQTTSYSVPAPSTDGFAQGDRLPHLIKSTARNLAGDYDTRVQIADLKKAMPAVDPARMDQALKQMQRNGDLVLYQNDDPITIRPQDRAAAVHISGEPRHLIYMHERTRVR